LLTQADLLVKKEKKYRSAIKCARQALAFAQEINSISVLPDCFLTMGKLSGQTGSPRKAQGYFNRALKRYAALGKTRRLAETYFENGRMLLSGRRPDRAAVLFAKARAIYRKLNLEHKIKELTDLWGKQA
jgi:tetratricopeptide (TPR) repeat protein